jgi:hypothetical protein
MAARSGCDGSVRTALLGQIPAGLTDLSSGSPGDGRLTCFEADSNPAARVGGDLLDISEKVQYIGVNSEQDGVTELAAIKNAADVNALVGAVLQAPVNQQLTDHSGARYFVAFHLEDGTAVVRAYWPATGELSRGIALPQQFRPAIELALRH